MGMFPECATTTVSGCDASTDVHACKLAQHHAMTLWCLVVDYGKQVGFDHAEQYASAVYAAQPSNTLMPCAEPQP